MIELKCLECGNLFYRHKYVLKTGRGKFCSKICSHKGLSKIAKERGFGKWMKGKIIPQEIRDKQSQKMKGKMPKNFAEMQKLGWEASLGHTPWNKNLKGTHFSPDTEFKLSGITFDGTTSEYKKLHYLISKNFGKPETCESCGKIVSGKGIHWANISGEYKTDREDWVRLCSKCHFYQDKQKGQHVSN